jgi:hypothetical protein
VFSLSRPYSSFNHSFLIFIVPFSAFLQSFTFQRVRKGKERERKEKEGKGRTLGKRDLLGE